MESLLLEVPFQPDLYEPQSIGGGGGSKKRAVYVSKTTIDKLPDKVLLHLFSYLPHREICRLARVCKKWRTIAYDTKLWAFVSLRPEISGLHVPNSDALLALLGARFGNTLRYIELPIDLLTHIVLHEMASKCPNLTHMVLDFSSAMQLHDFNDLQAFPAKLRCLCICLSEVIFMEGFMRKVYNFLNGLEVLHLIGTYEKVTDEEEEVYEVINIHKLKSATPNLKVINLYGIIFLDDSHVEAFSSNCIQLECLSVAYCNKFTGSALKILLSRCKRIKCLLMQHTNLQSEHVMAAEWEKSSIVEIDITASEISTEALTDLFTRIPALRYLSAGQQDGFTDSVLKAFMEQGNPKNLIGVDLDSCDNLSTEMLFKFVKTYGHQLRGLVLSGIPQLTESFWSSVLSLLKNIRILVMGMPEGCCKKIISKIPSDGLMDNIANHCPHIERLELRWDPATLRFSDKSQKAVDAIRVKATKLTCLVLSDGQYFELVKANFERADRCTVVRTTTNCHVTLCYLLLYYKDLLFN